MAFARLEMHVTVKEKIKNIYLKYRPGQCAKAGIKKILGYYRLYF